MANLKDEIRSNVANDTGIASVDMKLEVVVISVIGCRTRCGCRVER